MGPPQPLIQLGAGMPGGVRDTTPTGTLAGGPWGKNQQLATTPSGHSVTPVTSDSSQTEAPAGTPPHQAGRWLWHSHSGPMLSLSPESFLQGCAASCAQIQPLSSLAQCLWEGQGHPDHVTGHQELLLHPLSPPRSCSVPPRDVSGRVLPTPDLSLEWWHVGNQVSPPRGWPKAPMALARTQLRAPAMNHWLWAGHPPGGEVWDSRGEEEGQVLQESWQGGHWCCGDPPGGHLVTG